MRARLIVVRHGESRSNVDKLIHGTSGSDIGLSEKGMQQAAKAGDKLANKRFTHAYTSDFTRALETAQIILKQNNHFKDPSKLRLLESLRERHFGVFESRPFAELRESAIKAKINTKTLAGLLWDYIPEGAETGDELVTRADLSIRTILKDISNDRTEHPVVLVCTHGMFIAGLLHYFYEVKECKPKENSSEHKEVFPGNTSISEFDIDVQQDDFAVQAIYLNDFSHIEGM